MSVLEDAFYGSGWDESEHPRWPKSDPHGGQFRPKGGAGAPDEDPIIANRTRRVPVKVGQAKNLREEMFGWYYGREQDPEIASIDENWGNWTQSELYRLRDELQKQLHEGGWAELDPSQIPEGEYVSSYTARTNRKWVSSGLLSSQYAKEIGRSLSQARNEGKRVLEAVDKALTIEQFGMDKAMELYPELFETKTKPKPIDPRSQGIPEVYLSEKGTFKPGYDAKLKSDLVNSYFDLNPQKSTPVRTVPSEGLKQRVIDDWKARNPSRTQDSTGREWTDEEIWPTASTDIADMKPELYDEYMKYRKVRNVVESTLLHRFEPGEAYRILEGRGWLDHLEKKKNVIGRPVIGEPNLDNRRSREILESVYSHSNSNEWTTTPPETTRGEGVSAIGINGFHLRPVQELVGSAAEIPDKIHKQLAAKGVQLYFGPPESTDLDEMWGIRDEKARNRDRRTMKQVAGFYSPSSKRVIISSDPRYGSASLATHEIGHAIGDVLGVDHHPELHLWHNKLKPKLGRYYLQNGNDFAGAQELWAEGVALHYHLERNRRLGREVTYRRSGPFKDAATLDTPDGNDYMRWVRKTLEELEEGRQMPQNR